jgi:hypothetical protein
VATRGARARDDAEVAGGIRFVAVAFVTVAAAASPAAAAQADATGPTPARSSPASTAHSTPGSQPAGRVGPASDPAAGFGVLRPSSESGDVTRLLLLLLLGLVMLVVIPTQVAKGVAQRRRQAALATARVRRSRRRP